MDIRDQYSVQSISNLQANMFHTCMCTERMSLICVSFVRESCKHIWHVLDSESENERGKGSEDE